MSVNERRSESETGVYMSVCACVCVCVERRGRGWGRPSGKSTHARTKISIILFYEFTRSGEC